MKDCLVCVNGYVFVKFKSMLNTFIALTPNGFSVLLHRNALSIALLSVSEHRNPA